MLPMLPMHELYRLYGLNYKADIEDAVKSWFFFEALKLGYLIHLHPLDNAHAEHTKKGLQSRLTLKTSSKEGSHLLSRIALQYHRRKRV